MGDFSGFPRPNVMKFEYFLHMCTHREVCMAYPLYDDFRNFLQELSNTGRWENVYDLPVHVSYQKFLYCEGKYDQGH
jgi:hypothetical protein